jgi:hypothetical protein
VCAAFRVKEKEFLGLQHLSGGFFRAVDPSLAGGFKLSSMEVGRPLLNEKVGRLLADLPRQGKRLKTDFNPGPHLVTSSHRHIRNGQQQGEQQAAKPSILHKVIFSCQILLKVKAGKDEDG